MIDDIENLDSITNIKRLFNRKSLLDVLVQVEKFLDSMNIYVYPNWYEGEIVAGPEIKRYWVTVVLKFDYNSMPDPSGAAVLSQIGVLPKYDKITEKIPVKIQSPDDYRPGTKKPKLEEKDFWYVTLKIPRRVIDEADLDDLEVISNEIDIDDISDADDKGFSDE